MPHPADRNAYIVSLWLFTTASFVFAMAVIGAITRLTESGLSMVEWRPLIGALPPFSPEEWERVFALYKQTPEYEKVHFWMGLEDFKRIFFWEWFHRFWGRLIGVVYGLPLLIFWIRNMIPPGFKPVLLGILALGAGQAVMGWYMVESGLIDRPDVSHFRLAAHLGLAFVIYAALLWTGLMMRQSARVKHAEKADLAPSPLPAGLKRLYASGAALLALTITWGAYVAGLDAGLVYNTWPLMGRSFLPGESFSLSAPLNNPIWVQFTHRWIAIIAGLLLLILAWRVHSLFLGLAVILQILLGIGALLSQVWIPLAALHQAGAFLVVTALILSLHKACHKMTYRN